MTENSDAVQTEEVEETWLDYKIQGWTFSAAAKPEPEGSGETIDLQLRFKGKNVLELFVEAQAEGVEGFKRFLDTLQGQGASEAIGQFYSNEQMELSEKYMDAFSRSHLKRPLDHLDPKGS